MREAVEAGVQAIMITVDTPVVGNREADSKQPSSAMMDCQPYSAWSCRVMLTPSAQQTCTGALNSTPSTERGGV